MAPTVNQPTLGERIERRREELGLTKSEAARQAGVSRGTWHEVESGKRANMLASTLALFDKALGYERGTLRRLSRGEPRPNETVALQTPVYVSHGSEDPGDLALRMQLIRMAMTMASDDVHTVLMLVSARDNELPPETPLIEQLARQVRALSIADTEDATRDNESGRSGPRTAQRRSRSKTAADL